MALLNSKIMICKNIKLDEKNVNVLNYNEEQMLNLCNSNRVAYSDTYSFIKDDESILVNFSYSDCLQSNYIAFQNPNYSNKWFFGFIDEVIYKGDSCTEIKFKIDSWSTWYGNWNVSDCFVVREHVNDDTIGKNTFPEALETGEYIYQPTSIEEYLSGWDFYQSGTYTVAAVSDTGLDVALPDGGREYNGSYSGLIYLVFSKYSDCDSYIHQLNEKSKTDVIYSLFTIPKELAKNTDFLTYTGNRYTFQYGFLPYTKLQVSLTNPFVTNTKKLDNNYIPKNNKLLCYPYRYFLISNNAGTVKDYKYEFFTGDKCNFDVIGAISVGCSVKAIPSNYNKSETFSHTDIPLIEGVDACKLPTCSWLTDPYTNWLTQTAVNRTTSNVASAASIIGGAAMIATGAGTPAGIGMIAGGVTGITNQLTQMYEHSLVPITAHGGENQGDLNFATKSGFSLYKMSIRKEYAEKIDNFFSRFGYKVNLTKKPNITGRKYWNFIQIGNTENIGYGNVPKKFMEEINTIAQNGTTIWHDHANIGNFSLNNTII